MTNVEKFTHNNLEYEIRSAEIDKRYRIKVFLDHKQVGLDYDCDGQDQGIKNALMEQVKSDIISGKLHN